MAQAVSIYKGTYEQAIGSEHYDSYGYNAGYEEGYRAALQALKDAQETGRRSAARAAEARKALLLSKLRYHIVQKSLGALLLGISICGIAYTQGDFGVALFTIPLSLFLIITRKDLFK